ILYGHKHGDSLATIAKNIKCSKTTVHDTLKRYAQTGSTMPRKCLGPKAIFNESALEELRKMVTQDTKYCRLSLKEIQDLWKKEKNQKVSISTICHALKKCGPIVPIHSTINGEVYTKLIRRHAISAIC
ncbi:13104_t:CDS:2, partial [Cetraspora pellucida]